MEYVATGLPERPPPGVYTVINAQTRPKLLANSAKGPSGSRHGVVCIQRQGFSTSARENIHRPKFVEITNTSLSLASTLVSTNVYLRREVRVTIYRDPICHERADTINKVNLLPSSRLPPRSHEARDTDLSSRKEYWSITNGFAIDPLRST